MKLKSLWVILMMLVWVGHLQAKEQRGALILNKIPIYEFEDARKNVCVAMYDVEYGKNVPDMREFRDFLCQGRYELSLRGEKGRTVTLFAKFHFDGRNGFLVVRKLDDRLVWISDLESIPAGKWVTVPANNSSGAYEAYYKEGPLFDQRISSVKWGQWWQGDTPS